ncbi:MAG: putative esterase [Candidatus Roizmanbacteria bacterium GW2011_GWA2_35_8]|uniref:Putative esterase n=1 Tax=Candidatus Roizmanbacteria bacterium GW2011_GWA2_35_8 TaxID=1618479 RepID=A0A0G0DF64_9BACT|nr:MAG: putative esterase [Candidatus Roizmanbacteria bacterium GW2011_GWA2_35_8]
MKKALILHGWYNKPEDVWYPWLKKELENKGYKVTSPEIPTFNLKFPQLKESLEFIENNYLLDKETTIIGHSLGCLLAMRLAEKYQCKKMILVAGWDYDDLTPEHQSFWPNKINHEQIRKNVKKIFVVASNNDPYISLYHVQEMTKRLNGEIIVIKNGGHFASEEKTKYINQLMDIL